LEPADIGGSTPTIVGVGWGLAGLAGGTLWALPGALLVAAVAAALVHWPFGVVDAQVGEGLPGWWFVGWAQQFGD